MRMSFTVLGAILCAVLFGCKSGASSAALPPVIGFDAEKYMGQWYEIARLPHSFERGLYNVTAFYSLEKDGTIRVENRGYIPKGTLKTIYGVAFQPEPGIGLLRVSFFRPFYGDYKIIFLEKDYSAAIVTSSTKDYLWILCRTPELPKKKMQEYLDFIKKCGFPTDKLEILKWQRKL